MCISIHIYIHTYICIHKSIIMMFKMAKKIYIQMFVFSFYLFVCKISFYKVEYNKTGKDLLFSILSYDLS